MGYRFERSIGLLWRPPPIDPHEADMSAGRSQKCPKSDHRSPHKASYGLLWAPVSHDQSTVGMT